MVANAVPGFLPSRYGLRFANRFPPGPTLTLAGLDPRWIGIGDASLGLCGGMALTARDLFEAQLPAPLGADSPENGSRRFRSLVRRQVESLDWLRGPLRDFDLQALRPDPPTGLAARLGREPARVPSLLREWPRIRVEIDAGSPSVVGLIRAAGASPWALTQHHQVLAFRYEADDSRLSIGVYDPNHPGRDDVTLEILVAPPGPPWRERIRLRQSTGEPLLGFLRQPYPGPRSVAAWR